MIFKRRAGRANRHRGFSLIEALIGIAVIGIAMLGLAQIFLLSVSNNTRAGEISHATLLAQQRIDYLRSLTADEMNTFPSTLRGESSDEPLDPNSDGTLDFRRITVLQSPGGGVYTVKVYIFPAVKIGVSKTTLVGAPSENRVRAILSTVITR
jgi:prepilin-type N-terminal cleavage/methylation domain-containing protein